METIIIWAIIFIVCAFVGGNITSSKGRSYNEGFLFGLLLGIIGVIIAALLPKSEKGLEKKSLSAGDSKKCPYCAEIIKREAVVCRFCGKELPKEQRSDQAISISKEDFSKLTYRQQVAVREFKYLLSPEDAEQVGKLMGNFQDQAAKDFCRSYGQAVSSFDE
jgi:hypothetical protein